MLTVLVLLFLIVALTGYLPDRRLTLRHWGG